MEYILDKYDDDTDEMYYLVKRAVGRMMRSYKKDNAFDPTVQRSYRTRRIRIGEFDKHRGLKVSELRYHKKKQRWVWVAKWWPTKKRTWDSAFLELKMILDGIRRSDFIITILIKN